MGWSGESEFPRSLAGRKRLLASLDRRGLRGVKLVISGSHEGIQAAASKVLKATWQRGLHG
jgi:transposase-like protein